MDLGFGGWLLVIGLAILLWWFGFIATKQMREEKNRKREAMWQKILEEKKQQLNEPDANQVQAESTEKEVQ